MIRLTTLALAVLFAGGFLSGCSRGTQVGDQVAGGDPPPQGAMGAAANQPPAQEAPAQPATAKQSGSHVGERTKEILDAREMVKDPNWTVIATDPQEVKGYSFAGTAYNRAVALAGTADLEKWVQLEQAQSESGGFPTYASLKDYIAKNPVDMPHLREYHHYGYDETPGQVVILENEVEKEGRQRELGLPVGE